jgi:hypothetical protein
MVGLVDVRFIPPSVTDDGAFENVQFGRNEWRYVDLRITALT